MDKKKIELIITAVLIAVFVFVLAGSIKKVGQKLKKVSSVTATVAVVPGRIKPSVAAQKVVKPEALKETAGEERDPFALPEVGKSTASAISDIKLTGITTNGKGKAVALINENIVSVGGKVGDFTVVEISGNKVVLTDGKQNYDLKLER
jgi:hypothetical protein